MGLSSGTIVNEGVQFCVFDLKRGQHEGEEVDKILYFFPFDSPYSVQLSVIGLSEGLITFTRSVVPSNLNKVSDELTGRQKTILWS